MIQQRTIYQIGDVVLHAHHRNAQSQQYNARGSSAELQDTYRVVTATSAHKQTIRTEQVEILLFSNGVFSPAHTAELLKTQLGVYQDIISYVYITPETAPAGLECSCAMCGCCPCQLLWMHNSGVLKAISIQPVDNDVYSASLTFELNSYWKPLNRLLWQIGNIGVSRPIAKRSFDSVTALDGLMMDYPNCESIENNCMQFYKNHFTSLAFLNDPYWQVNMNCNLPLDHPEIGYAKHWSSQKADAIIHIHQWLWSAPPLSIYSFTRIKNLETKAIIRITSQESNREIVGRTTINFARVNNLAASNNVVLKNTDILQVGDVFGFARVIRNGNVILYCADAVNRTHGDFPGYLTPGTNTLHIYPKGANFAHYHQFRSL